ncbi:MAG TPA: CPBP family intramembrane glutamic endopeptidase [Edaphobacter sp.]|nr:CPBP family intramembrane glutamic endopeptidase [Edaphobacter sp.]
MNAFDTASQSHPDRPLQFSLFLLSAVWFFVSQSLAGRAAMGLSVRFNLSDERKLLTVLFLLFLLAIGFSFLQMIAHREPSLRMALGLPKRPTSAREWGIGAAIGWGLVVLAVIPMVLAGALHVEFWTQPRAFWLVVLNLATLAIAALAEEVAFRGYPFRRLIEVIGPVKATILMSVLFGALHMLNPDATWISVLITMFAGVLLSIAWLRTHGLWLPWGLHFGWNASMGILFGLPVSGIVDFSSVVQTQAVGRTWLTGGYYGPEGAFFTIIVLAVGIIVVVRATRDYKWEYTYKPIIAGGYPVDVPPPAAHTAMEQDAKPPALVQILPVEPQSRPSNEPPK